MKNTGITKYMLMLAIGFILIVLDVHVYTNFNYPNEYLNSHQVIGEFQYYTLASTYGARCTYKLINSEGSGTQSALTETEAETTQTATQTSVKVIDQVFFKNIRIDIFSDFIGFLLIMIACFKLGIVSKRFRIAGIFAVFGFLIKGVLSALPFITNGLLLCNLTLGVGISYLACNLATVFFFVSGLLGMCLDVCCRDERKWCRICWFVTFVLQILMTFVLWLGSDFGMLYNLGIFCEGLLVFMIVLFWMILRRTLHYLQKSYDNALENFKNQK